MKSLASVVLKERGHALIDELEGLGMPRTRIYIKLGKRMRVPEARAHFSQVDDIITLQRMVWHLSDMRRIVKEKLSFPPEESTYDYSKIFNNKDVLRSVGERNRRKNSLRLQDWPRWRRALYCVLDFLHGTTK